MAAPLEAPEAAVLAWRGVGFGVGVAGVEAGSADGFGGSGGGAGGGEGHEEGGGDGEELHFLGFCFVGVGLVLWV